MFSPFGMHMMVMTHETRMIRADADSKFTTDTWEEELDKRGIVLLPAASGDHFLLPP